MMQVQVGDKIKTRGRLGVWHYGVFVGNDRYGRSIVIHNAKGGGVNPTTLEDFAPSQPFYIVQSPSPGNVAKVVERAKALVGMKYDLLNFNCEHFAALAHGEAPESKQLQTAGWMTASGLLLWALYEPKKWDSNVGQYRRPDGRFAGA